MFLFINTSLKTYQFSILLLLTSLFGYLEWSETNHAFLVEAEVEIFKKILTHPSDIIHPFTIIPVIGQLFIILSFVIQRFKKLLIYSGIVSLGLLIGFIFIIGCLSINYKIILSTTPFIVTVIFTVIHLKKQ